MAEFQVPPSGFDSYLNNILPTELAIAAGAFSTTMQQIRNIKSVEFQKFAQVVASLETATKNLPQVNGTNVPTNTTLSTAGHNLIALGSGVNGSYTLSDLFGCMSSLQYPWKKIQTSMQSLQTTKLKNIYEELFLAVTWEQATFSVTTEQQAVETSPGSGLYNWQFRITGTTMTDPGGGYSRGGAPNPGGDYTLPSGTLVSSGGVLLTAQPDTDVNNISTTYGRMINLVVSGTPGSWVTYQTNQPSSTPTNPGIQYRLPAPPTATLAVQANGSKATGGTNTAYNTTGWPTMDGPVAAYITQANTEIENIYLQSVKAATSLNDMYNNAGTQLKIEQRTRYYALPPVPIPRDTWTTLYPLSIYNFVDAIPNLAQNTMPDMSSQTLEAISNLDTVGGQSVVAMLRQERNKVRLSKIGINLDNNIPGKLSQKDNKVLLANTPSTLVNKVAAEPIGSYDEDTNKYVVDNTPVDTGEPLLPGSLAGSPYSELIPITLSSTFASGAVLPSDFTVQEAIEEVIKCNCDCWVN